MKIENTDIKQRILSLQTITNEATRWPLNLKEDSRESLQVQTDATWWTEAEPWRRHERKNQNAQQ